MTKKSGRPTKYKDTYPDQLYEHMKGGLSFESFGGVIGVAETTLHKWKNHESLYFHKEFLQSYKRGRTASMLHWEEMGHDMVLAGQGNATAWIFNMKNRFSWRDKMETDITSGGEKLTGPIPMVPKRDGERILDTTSETTGGTQEE